MCNHDRGPVLRDFVQSCLYDFLAADINSTSSLIKDQDFRLLYDASRNGESLPLTAAKLDSCVTALSVISLRFVTNLHQATGSGNIHLVVG